MTYGIDDTRLGKLLLDIETLELENQELRAQLAAEIDDGNDQARLVIKFASLWDKEHLLADRLAQALRVYICDTRIQHPPRAIDTLNDYQKARGGLS